MIGVGRVFFFFLCFWMERGKGRRRDGGLPIFKDGQSQRKFWGKKARDRGYEARSIPT